MFCSRCGTSVQDKSKFCPSCGLDLISTTPMAAIVPPQAAQASAPAEPSETDIVRDALKDEYEILSELGRGGMAIVFRAKEKLLDREVAVKVLPFSLAFDAEFVERFQREARTSAKLEHPNIIPIYRVGKNGRVIYFVMKFLRGKSLSDVIEKGPLAPAEARKLLSQAASALGYAHKNGIVHRDIKPDNIMLDELGNGIVTDFGIAKAVSGTKLTGTGMAIGTPHYMSPEQARAQPLDGRSDIYSLGVVGYQCLTGVVPFDGEDSFAIGYKHIMEEVPVPDLKTAEQRELFQIIKRMMAKTADERLDAEELVKVLGGATLQAPTPKPQAVSSSAATTFIQTPKPGSKTGLGPPPPPLATPNTPTTPIPRHDARPPAPKKKSGSGVLVGFLLFVLLGGGGGSYYWFVMKPQQEAAAAAALKATQGASAPTSTPAESTAAPAANVPAAPVATTGTFVFTGVLPGSRVYLDGNPVAPTGDSISALDPGSYAIVVKKTGYEDFRVNSSLARGDRKTIAVTMTKPGSLAKAPSARPATKAAAPKAELPPPVSTALPSCTEFGDNYNQDNMCYDARPNPKDPFVPVTDPALSSAKPAQLLVYVKADGKVETVRQTQNNSDNPLFTLAAMQYARSMEFNPAQKDGRPVAAWTKVVLRPRSQ